MGAEGSVEGRRFAVQLTPGEGWEELEAKRRAWREERERERAARRGPVVKAPEVEEVEVSPAVSLLEAAEEVEEAERELVMRELALRRRLVAMAEKAVEVLEGMVFDEGADVPARVRLQAVKALFSVSGVISRRLLEARRDAKREAAAEAEGAVLGAVGGMVDEELAEAAGEVLRRVVAGVPVDDDEEEDEE